MAQVSHVRASVPEKIEYDVSGVGGSSEVTQEEGDGVTLTRTGTGAYLLTWANDPGVFVGLTYGLSATTPGNIAGHTLIAGLYSTSAFTLAFIVYNASDAAHDLAALEHMHLTVNFKTTSI